MAMIFKEMLKPENIGEITRGDLKTLSLDQLEAFARLLGIPHSGIREKRVQRIYNALVVRHLLTESDNPNYYAAKYRLAVLKRHTKNVGSYAGLNKYGLAVGLLNWRIRCRTNGQRFYNKMRAEAANHPKQIRLF